jgi:hypothetical protein
MTRWLLVLLLLFTGIAEAEDGFTSWYLSDHAVTGPRIGYQWSSVELGGQALWSYDDDNDPTSFGAYGLYHLPESISISELPVLGNLPIEAASYLGMQLLVDVYDDDDDGEERTYFGPVAGTVINKFIFDSVRDTISIVSEAQYLVYFDDNEEDFRVLLGLRILIP